MPIRGQDCAPIDSHQLAGHRAYRFGISSGTAERLQLALETSEIGSAVMAAKLRLPDIE